MKKKLNIGVIGAGFVGAAVAHVFKNNNLFVVDPMVDDPVWKERHVSVTRLNPVLSKSVAVLYEQPMDAVFVCVSTPMGPDGAIDTTNVENVFGQLKDLEDTIVVLKSTVIPSIVAKYEAEISNFVYNPEFLTEKEALWDAEHPISNVYGGKLVNTKKLEDIFMNHSICTSARTFHMTAAEASYVKYTMNSFLATKVLFFNQLKDLVESTGSDFEKVRSAVANDKRIGMSHTHVPGFDERKGYGSACFSKDVPALVNYSINVGKEFTLLRESWNANCDYRNSYGQPLPREVEQHIVFNKI
jgi:UDPglucose 6-dehydrogenase